jgi:hypothetical protein
MSSTIAWSGSGFGGHAGLVFLLAGISIGATANQHNIWSSFGANLCKSCQDFIPSSVSK